tara:strand:+ start:2544 stop:3008 length:465 start_codon:yes stop_codon:yes gene_type:complete
MATSDWALCDANTGNIEHIISVNNSSDFSFMGFYNGFRTIGVERDLDHVKAMEESYYDYDDEMFKTRNKKPQDFYKWTVAKKWELDREGLLAELRMQRQGKLYECDWTQLDDAQLSITKKGEWTEYRQKLRDLPTTIAEDLDTLEGFPWPAKPS